MALILDVHLEGIDHPVGKLVRQDDGGVSFRYLSEDLPFPISLSLPIREEPFGDRITRAFFSNLIFENAERDQIMQRHRLDYNDVVGLLVHLGRDCPGAISCVPEGAGPAKMPGRLSSDYDPLTDAEVREIMVSLQERRRIPDHTRDPSPLAGVQGKIALARLGDGRFALPRVGLNVPTTHILKVPSFRDITSVSQEHLLTRMMAELQPHPVSQTEIMGEGELQGLLITRFDRRTQGDAVSRIHQEDFAQALGLGPGLKYQRNGTAGHAFSAKAVGAMLAQTESPGIARAAFLNITLANLLLGNTDNHAKNHALLYTGPRPILAPAYDIVPVLIDAQVTHQLAFDIGSAQMGDDIVASDLEQLVRDLGFARMTPALRKSMGEVAGRAVEQINRLQGPGRKPIGDAMAAMTKALVEVLGVDLVVPERDTVFVNRP